MTLGKLSHKDMRHCNLFLNSTCDNEDPHQEPHLTVTGVVFGCTPDGCLITYSMYINKAGRSLISVCLWKVKVHWPRERDPMHYVNNRLIVPVPPGQIATVIGQSRSSSDANHP